MANLIDHLVVVAADLEAGAAHVEAALGLAPGGGGKHATMGTHNRLLSLGPEDYLEAIAPDPEAKPPCRARWFGLDAAPAVPRLGAWALRVDDLEAALAEAPEGIGQVMRMWRGDFTWAITVPEDGVLPFDGLYPALIQWSSAPPAPALPEREARLVTLTLSHPRSGELGWWVSQITDDDRIVFRRGPVGIEALIHTPDGERVLR